jgi:uncharacterized RDD family membrane protein YckC
VGQLPFEAEGPRGSSSDFLIKQAHVQQPAPDPRSIRPDIPENIARAVLKALSKEPAQRFSSCAEFSSALGRMQGMPAALDSREPLAMHMAGPDNSPEATRRVSRENELRAAAREGIRREAAPMSDAPSPKTPPGPAIESLRSDTPKGPATVELATIRIRFWAYFIDIILIVMVLIFLMVLITKRSGDMNEPGQSSVIAAIYLILISFYEFLFLTIGGRTPGKKLMGIKVVTMNGDELSAGRAAVRVLVRSGLAFAWEGILAIVNYLFAFGESRRCIHDWAAGTQVIKKR